MIRAALPAIPAIWLVAACNALAETGPACPPDSGVALQVLGSGGPIADDARASSSYLVWVDGKARVLVDSGGGSFLRFGETGARFEDLELVALSHFHTDHSADLPALLKSGYFTDRKRPLHISGPTAGGPFPGLGDFLRGMLDPGQGAYRYLSGYLDGTDGLVRVATIEVAHGSASPALVIEQDELRVTALGVPHGIVPTLAYRVEAGGKVMVFGSDQNGSSAGFAEFAGSADLLVAHMAIPETAGRGARSLHATPSKIGEMAATAKAPKLLLSHFMSRSLAALDESLEFISAQYPKEMVLAEDLLCLLP